MNIRSRKGLFLLVAAIAFLILSAVIATGFYMFAFQVSRETSIGGVEPVRGYYVSIAGLRYINILLQEPARNFGFDATWNGESKTIDIVNEAKYSQFKTDIGLKSSDTFTIFVEEYNSSSPQWTPANTYRVTVTFKS